MWIADDFQDELAGFILAALEASSDTIYGLRDDFSIGFYNQAWRTFALSNGADPEWPDWRRVDVLEVCDPALRPFYASLFLEVLERREPADHIYSCPSPSRHRSFKMRVRPLVSGLLVSNHLWVEGPHEGPAHLPDPARYTDDAGVITQCCHCRLTRRASDPNTWDWVPVYVEVQPDNLSHGLCPLCFQLHYPDAAKSYYAQKH